MQELQKILDIAEEQYEANVRRDFLNEEITDESSFIIRKKDSYLQKMNFDTPIQLQKQLQEMWSEESDMKLLEKAIVVAAFKFKSSEIVLEETISEKIYNF